MVATFEDLMASERERLTKEREEIFNQQQVLEDKLSAIKRELDAIDAYDAVKKGKAATSTASQGDRRPRGPAKGTKRTDGGGRRAAVLDLIRRNPQGLTAGEISEQLNATDKTGKQAVANALSVMKGEGLITQAQKRGPYTVSSGEAA